MDWLVEGFEVEPSKAELREISRELHGEKGRSQIMAQPLLRSEIPLIVDKVFGMVQEVKNIAHTGQRTICMLLRRLGVAQ